MTAAQALRLTEGITTEQVDEWVSIDLYAEWTMLKSAVPATWRLCGLCPAAEHGDDRWAAVVTGPDSILLIGFGVTKEEAIHDLHGLVIAAIDAGF